MGGSMCGYTCEPILPSVLKPSQAGRYPKLYTGGAGT